MGEQREPPLVSEERICILINTSDASIISTQSDPSVAEHYRVSTSQSTSTDWTTCLFRKNKTHTNIKQMTNGQNMPSRLNNCSNSNRNEDTLRINGAVNNDVVAAEARYHKACHATYNY